MAGNYLREQQGHTVKLVTTTSDDAQFEKWLTWFERINDDVTYLHRDRQVWRGLVAMIDANPAIPEGWWIKGWITQQAVRVLALGIRRQTDKAEDVVSLVRLLREIKRNPTVISRDRYTAVCSPGNDKTMVQVVQRNFDAWAGPGGTQIDPALVQDRLDALYAAANNVRVYVNKILAHADEKDPSLGFTFGELDKALDVIGEVFRNTYLLLKCSDLMSPNPTIINPWKRAFLVPWESDEAVERWLTIQTYKRVRRSSEEE